MYPDQRVTRLITSETIPVRAHVKENPAYFGRFRARWTPTVLFLDDRGNEVHRIEGFLPTDEFLGQLQLGIGFAGVARKDWKKAEEHFARAASEHPRTDAGPAGIYWTGVAQYSADHDATHLQETWRRLHESYPNTSWTKRAEVWKPKETGRAAA